MAATDAARIDQIAALERLKAAAATAQARVTAAFAASQGARLAAAKVPPAEAARSIGAQVALARRDSPSKGSRHLGFAEALVAEMPATLAALVRGDTSEWRATRVVRETAVLSKADRRAVDADLAARLADLAAGRRPARLGGWPSGAMPTLPAGEPSVPRCLGGSRCARPRTAWRS